MRYPRAGAGPAVVLIHGFAGSAESVWREAVPALESSHTVYAIDLLGQGLSAKPAADYSIELRAAQVGAFVEEVMGEPATLIGTSFGSLIALALAADERSAGSVKSLALMNCAIGMNNQSALSADDVPSYQRAIAGLVLDLVDWLLAQRPLLEYAFANLATEEAVGNALRGAIYHNAGHVDGQLIEAYLAPAADPAAMDVLRRIYTGDPGPLPAPLIETVLGRGTQPMLVVWGREDQLTPLAGPIGTLLAAERGHEQLTFRVVKGAGHVPHDDQPEVVHGSPRSV